MAVFVVDQRHRPLMPCAERRARLLLARGRAVVHRLVPFTIRLRDRRREASVLQPVVLKFDPAVRPPVWRWRVSSRRNRARHIMRCSWRT